MSKDPALLVYTKDFLEGTADMHESEVGVYWRLLCHQHQRGVLPSSHEKLARLAGTSIESFEKYWPSIKDKFTLTENGYINDRCADEVARRSQKGRSSSVRAVFANWVKYQNPTKKQLARAKSLFKTEDFLGIDDDDERKEKIIDFLNSVAIASSKGSHIATGDGTGTENKTENEGALDFSLFSDPIETQAAWAGWIEYKKTQHDFEYKDRKYEQIGINKLADLSVCDSATALAIICQSIDQGWQGLFELKTNLKVVHNGKSKGTDRKQDIANAVSAMLSGGESPGGADHRSIA